MNFTEAYNKEFASRTSGAPIYTSRGEWESAPCQIDMTRVTDAQMQEFVDKFYLGDDGDVMFDEAEKWLMANTKAKYLEDYGVHAIESYRKRSKELYYKK